MAENDTDVKERLAELTRVLQEVKCSVTNLDSRLEEIEKKGNNSHPASDNGGGDDANNRDTVQDARVNSNDGNVQDNNVNSNGGIVNSEDNSSSERPRVGSRRAGGSDSGVQPTCDPVAVQELFKIIQDSVIRVRLPTDLKLHDSGSVKKKCQPVYNVVRRCARYTETILKIFAHVSLDKADAVTVAAIQDIYTCLTAEINFLQEEYTAILVQGRFGEEAADVFHDLQKNTSLFTEDRLPIVKTAIELANLRSIHNQGPQRGGFDRQGTRGSFGYYRGRGGPQFRSYDRDMRPNRGRDVFGSMASRSIPRDNQSHNNSQENP